MIEISREGVVPAPVDAVWSVVSDVRRIPQWLSFVERAELIAGEGEGRRQRVHGRWGSRRSEIDQVVTLYEPPRLIEWRHEAERLDGKPAPRFASETVFTVRLDAEGGATTVTFRSRQEPAGALKGWLMRLNARGLAAHLDRSLERLAMVAAAER